MSKVTCNVYEKGVRCGEEAIARLDNRIPVCKDHSVRYYRGGKDSIIGEVKMLEGKTGTKQEFINKWVKGV